MRRHGLAVPLLLIAIAASGCTDSAEPAVGESSENVDPSSSGEPVGGGTALTQAEAQAALADAIAEIDKHGSIGFTSQGENVIDDKITKITSSGAWTKNPLAWTTTTRYDRPKGLTFDFSLAKTTELIYVESTPRGVYVRRAFPDPQGHLPATVQRWALWRPSPDFPLPDGATQADIGTPRDLRILDQTTATAGTTLGNTVTVSGTIPSSTALDVLDLTSHLGGLGFANRFADSTTRVLVTIGADGLPQTLEFAGTNISLPGVGLPDYVAEELAGARYLVEYGDAKLKGPIKVPVKAFTP